MPRFCHNWVEMTKDGGHHRNLMNGAYHDFPETSTLETARGSSSQAEKAVQAASDRVGLQGHRRALFGAGIARHGSRLWREAQCCGWRVWA